MSGEDSDQTALVRRLTEIAVVDMPENAYHLS